MKKLLYLTTVLMAMMFVASCTDDVNFGPAPAPDGQQLYFDKDQPSKVKLELNQKEIKIPINRVETDEISTISILGTVVDKEGTAVTGIFTLPQSVTFAAGAKTADAVILVDFAALSVDKEYVVTLEIADEANTTPYGNSTYTFKASYPAPWKVLGKGLYADDIISAFGVDPGTTVSVEIQESEVTAGLYRLKNPYGEEFAEKTGFTGKDITYSAVDCYIEIDCTNPEAVTIAQQSIGITVDAYGALGMRSDEPGVLKDKIIKFPKKGLTLITPAIGKAYYANTNAAFMVALPGAVLISPEVKVEFVGSFIAPDATANALLQLTPNEDVRYYKYAVVDGSVKDITATVAGIIDGSIESIKHESAGEEEVVNYPLDKSGKYTAVVIPYGEKDYQGEPASVQFKFSVGGDTPVPDPTATITFDEMTHNSVSYTLKGENVVSGMTVFAPTAAVEEVLAKGASYADIVTANGTVMSDRKITGLNTPEGYQGKYGSLAPATSYTLIVTVVNADDVPLTIHHAVSTSTIVDDPASPIRLGVYSLPVESNNSYTNNLTIVKGTDANAGKFIMNGLFELNQDLIGVYDATAKTLTFDGSRTKDSKNVFELYLGNANAEKTWGFTFVAGPKGVGPIVFNVGARDALTTSGDMGLGVFVKETGEFKGFMETVASGTALTPVSLASVKGFNRSSKSVFKLESVSSDDSAVTNLRIPTATFNAPTGSFMKPSKRTLVSNLLRVQ